MNFAFGRTILAPYDLFLHVNLTSNKATQY